MQERQGNLLRSGKLERRLPVREDGPMAAPPSGKRPQGIEARKHLHQVSGQTDGSHVQPRPHVETSRQAMGSTAKTAVKERGVPVKSTARPIRKTARIGKPGGKPPVRAFPARQARRAAETAAQIPAIPPPTTHSCARTSSAAPAPAAKLPSKAPGADSASPFRIKFDSFLQSVICVNSSDILRPQQLG